MFNSVIAYNYKNCSQKYFTLLVYNLYIFRFAELFDKYYKEVFPARLVFVSFLPQHSEGQMVRALKDKGYSPLQFKLDDHKPDLTKLDSLIALLSLETTDFDDEVLTTEQKIKLNGLYSVFSELNLK